MHMIVHVYTCTQNNAHNLHIRAYKVTWINVTGSAKMCQISPCSDIYLFYFGRRISLKKDILVLQT